MSKKIYVDDYPSFVESKLTSDLETSFKSTDSDVIVNPKYSDYINKEIIVNLPCTADLVKLTKSNKVISRFPISPDIEVKPFPTPVNRNAHKVEDYSCLILSQSLLEDLDKKLGTSNKKFLVGLGTIIDGEATLVGYELCKTDLEKLVTDEDLPL